MTKLNLIIIERDNDLFDRLNQYIKQFSRYVDKIYRCLYPSDVYDVPDWEKCHLIISHNLEDVGVIFFKNLYLRPEVRKKCIYGLLYLKGQDNSVNFYRITRYLHEWSNHLFIGVIYKRYGSLEKILEIIRNIACRNNRIYPIFDWIENEDRVLFIDPPKLEIMRRLYNLRHKILINLQPLITTLIEFNKTKNIANLKRMLRKHHDFFIEMDINYQNLEEEIQEFLQLEYTDGHIKLKSMKSDVTYYKSELQNFFEIDKEPNNTLIDYVKVVQNENLDYAISSLIDRSNNELLEDFIKRYLNFAQALQGLIISLDEYYFLK